MPESSVCCSSCFGNKYIGTFIRATGEIGFCSYCLSINDRRVRAYTISVQDAYEYLIECVNLHYDEPHPDFIPYDSDIGGLIDDGESFGNVLDFLGADCKHQELVEDLERFAPNSLADLNSWVPTVGEYNRDRWDEFVDRIDEIAEDSGIARVDHHVMSIIDGLTRIIPLRRISPSRKIFRMRPIFDEDQFALSPGTLGSHPSPQNPNRFTPAGISAFYGAFNQDTALCETRRCETSHYAVGEWSLNFSILVADFARLPEYGGPFDIRTNKLHEDVGFIQAFIEEISKPAIGEDEPNRYLPTQIFYAAILQRFAKEGAHGMVYRSAKNPGGECLVLNIQSNSCVSKFRRRSTDAQLKLRKHWVHRIVRSE